MAKNYKSTEQKFPVARCIGVDIDGTLIRGGRLNEDLAAWAKRKKDEGFDVMLWSARGREYAEAVAAKFGIEDHFTVICGKPGYIVDDMGWNWIKFTRVLNKLL